MAPAAVAILSRAAAVAVPVASGMMTAATTTVARITPSSTATSAARAAIFLCFNLCFLFHLNVNCLRLNMIEFANLPKFRLNFEHLMICYR
jgi:hypothetical protein